MGSGAGADQATSLFEKGFSDLAYGVLLNRLPDAAEDVVTFKVLDTDLDNGRGVGAFVLLRNEQPLYIPVILSDNRLKPLEVIYHKALNIFLPLTKGWLDEVDKTALASLGKGIKTPESLYTDVDIRNIVVPPLTGRFSYASWEPVILADVADLLRTDALEKRAAAEPAPFLLAFLERAPNAVKLAFVRVLEAHAPLLKHAAALYGVTALRSALRPRREKQAAKQPFGGALWIADVDTTPTEFRRIFGDQAAEAYVGVRKRGFAARDERLQRNLAVQEQPYARWVEPQQPGVYLITSAEGDARAAFVMPNPIDLLADGTRYGRRPAIPGHNPLVENSYTDPTSFAVESNRVYPHGRPDESRYATRRTVPKYLAAFSNGDYLQADKLVGRDSIADSLDGGTLHQRMFERLSGTPKKGKGFFVRAHGTTFQATAPIEIQSVTNGSDGVRRIRITSPGGFSEKTVITEATNPYGTIWMPKGANVVYLPADFLWIPLATKLEKSAFFTSALDLAACLSQKLSAAGARKVTLKNAGAGQCSVDGAAPMGRVPTIKKLAVDFGLSVDDAEALVKKAALERQARAWVASPQQLALVQLQLEKRAATDDAPDGKQRKKPRSERNPASDAPTTEDEGDDLGAEAAMAAMAAPPAPPPPTPTDLAAMEMQQHLDAEMQKLQEKAEMLAMLAQRANEIAGGAPPAPTVQSQALGAPPPSANLATGAPLPQGGAPPMPDATPTMGAPMAGAVDASALAPMGDLGATSGGAAAAMLPDDAAVGGAMPPPMAMMGPDGPSAQSLAAEINPQFLEQAARLQSGDIFEAGAVASLAQSAAVRELVGQYLPAIERALDNLGRVLLTLWMQEPELKEEIGEAAFADLEENLRGTFKGLGDLVLKLNQGAHALHGEGEHAEA
jgi:hypothetical protein